MKAHKDELLAVLGAASAGPDFDLSAIAVWIAALNRLETDPTFPPELMTALRAARPRWVSGRSVAKEEVPQCS